MGIGIGRYEMLSVYTHLAGAPLNLLDDVKTAVDDELVHVPGLLGEARLAVAAGLGGAELVLEERVVLRPDYDEVVGHGVRMVARVSQDCCIPLSSRLRFVSEGSAEVRVAG